MVTSPWEESFRVDVTARLANDRGLKYRSKILDALYEHLADASKEMDRVRMEMYQASIIALERMPG